MSSATWLLTRRTLIQFPRNPMVLGFSVAPVLMMFVVFGALFESVKLLPGFPTDNYFEYLAPAAVLMTTVPGIANSAVGLATDFQSRYLYKLLTMPVSIGSIMAGRLLADGARLFVQGGAILLLAVALGAEIASGIAGALLILLIGTLFGIVTFGVLTANLALKSKDPAAVQAIFPMAFLLIFLTSAYQTEEQVPSGVLRAVIGANPTEYVLRAMRDLTLTRVRLELDRARIPRHRRPRARRAAAHRPELPLGLPLTPRVHALVTRVRVAAYIETRLVAGVRDVVAQRADPKRARS